jgi:hypothetical protein
MQVFASRLFKAFKLGLVPSFVLSLLLGCEGSGPAVPKESPQDGQVTAAKVAPLTPEEKRTKKGAARSAANQTPTGSQ